MSQKGRGPCLGELKPHWEDKSHTENKDRRTCIGANWRYHGGGFRLDLGWGRSECNLPDQVCKDLGALRP